MTTDVYMEESKLLELTQLEIRVLIDCIIGANGNISPKDRKVANKVMKKLEKLQENTREEEI